MLAEFKSTVLLRDIPPSRCPRRGTPPQRCANKLAVCDAAHALVSGGACCKGLCCCSNARARCSLFSRVLRMARIMLRLASCNQRQTDAMVQTFARLVCQRVRA